MVKQRMDLLELGVVWTETWTCCGKPGPGGRLMDAVSAQIGAQHGERSPERVTYRNLATATALGYPGGHHGAPMELHIPKLREGLLPQPAGNHGGAARRLCR